MYRDTHQSFLDYRERHEYFGAKNPRLGRDDFVKADAELNELEAKGDARDDEEEARFEELAKLLFRD